MRITSWIISAIACIIIWFIYPRLIFLVSFFTSENRGCLILNAILTLDASNVSSSGDIQFFSIFHNGPSLSSNSVIGKLDPTPSTTNSIGFKSS